uniref:NSFL1 cofactor p47 n=1 Tax=Romanomermis culicivorax TaxID=13658 RepID=A0A915JBN8_ROMCU
MEKILRNSKPKRCALVDFERSKSQNFPALRASQATLFYTSIMSNTENQIELINQFMSITSSNEETAKFYLDSAAWDVQAAVESFFENGPEIVNDQNNLNASSERVSNLSDQEDDVQIVEEHKPKNSPSKKIVEPYSSSGSSNAKNMAPKPNKRFATLSDLGPSKKNNEESSESDSGNESPADSKNKGAQQSFYVGGGEHSGQEVLGPRKPVKNASKIVDRLFKEAKALGAVDGSAASSSPSVADDVFSGAGIRLGDSTTGSSHIVPRTAPSAASVPPRVVPVRVAMYNNGLLVGDEVNLRLYSDPQTKAFIAAVMKGQIPHELTAHYPGSEIDLHMENHQNEEYVPPKAAVQAFSGQGYMLG